MADEPEIQADLPEPEKKPRAKKVRQTWPTEFDPKRSPPGSYAVKIPDEEWAAIHGEVPLSVYTLRGRYVMVDPNLKSDAGFMGETIRVDKGCRNCAARVLVVLPVGVVCIGCGATI